MKIDVAEDPSTPVVPTDQTSPIPQIIPIDTLKSTVDALHTAITLKRGAIRQEKKKRSQSNLDTIKQWQWQQEINHLENSIDFLSQLEPSNYSMNDS